MTAGLRRPGCAGPGEAEVADAAKARKKDSAGREARWRVFGAAWRTERPGTAGLGRTQQDEIAPCRAVARRTRSEASSGSAAPRSRLGPPLPPSCVTVRYCTPLARRGFEFPRPARASPVRLTCAHHLYASPARIAACSALCAGSHNLPGRRVIFPAAFRVAHRGTALGVDTRWGPDDKPAGRPTRPEPCPAECPVNMWRTKGDCCRALPCHCPPPRPLPASRRAPCPSCPLRRVGDTPRAAPASTRPRGPEARSLGASLSARCVPPLAAPCSGLRALERRAMLSLVSGLNPSKGQRDWVPEITTALDFGLLHLSLRGHGQFSVRYQEQGSSPREA